MQEYFVGISILMWLTICGVFFFIGYSFYNIVNDKQEFIMSMIFVPIPFCTLIMLSLSIIFGR